MPKRPPDYQVLVSYKELCALLEASRKLDELTKRQDRLQMQFNKLNERFLELMIAFGDLKKYVND